MERERDLYLQLLNLGGQDQLRPFLKEALALIVELGGARQGYLELYDDESGSEPRWSMPHGFSDDQVQCVRAAISSGIIAEALATGQPIATNSAVVDSRWGSRDSVLSGRIEAVLCMPIGEDPPCGVLYLQGPTNSELASEEGKARARIFARHLAPLVNRLLAEERRTRAEDPTRALRETLRLPGVIGRSPAFAKVLKQASQFAPLDLPVLLTGESGTGKSQLARIIHDNSPRAANRFLTLNCGGLSEDLASSQLFGHKKNAFTGATEDCKGVFEAADGGTLFLDEISEISQTVQVKLLHTLQEKEVVPLGAEERPPVRVDTRVIAATNIDLERAVAEGRFRKDLLSRLKVLPLRMPSLTERREDIGELVKFFCAKHSEINNLPLLEPSRKALRAIESAAIELPGNIRDLGNLVLQALLNAKSEGATQLERRHFFPEAAAEPGEDGPLTWREATQRFQRGLLADTLEAADWDITGTARRLGLVRAHVHNLINRFDLRSTRR